MRNFQAHTMYKMFQKASTCQLYKGHTFRSPDIGRDCMMSFVRRIDRQP